MKPVPFNSAEEAWFWTMRAIKARQGDLGPQNGAGSVARPCDPDDIMRTLDAIYRRRGIDLSHARVLRAYGAKGQRPDPTDPRQFPAFQLWREAMEKLDAPLRRKGIIADG